MLTPNIKYKMNGVTVCEKIIPDGTVWKNDEKAKAAGFNGAGDIYKKGKRLSGGTGKAQSVTIHNTGDLAGVYDDGEQYTRATFPNENMGSARVHFYVDDTGAWQNLKAGTGLCAADPIGAAEVSWHSGDGSTADGGNMTSLSMEIIMGENAANDEKAKDNGARIAAWLLWKHGLPVSKLFTHTYWVNKSAGKKFSDPDEQCTNLVSGKKWCPSYFFGSTNHATALKNWKAFKALVEKYLDQLNGKAEPEQRKPSNPAQIEAGDLVRIAGTTYYGGQTIPAWVKAKNWYVKSAVGARIVIDKSEDGKNAICSPVNSADLAVVKKAKETENTVMVGDKVKCNAGVTKYYNGVKMASWVPSATLYVRAIEKDGTILLVSTEPVKTVYTGRVKTSDVHKI